MHILRTFYTLVMNAQIQTIFQGVGEHRKNVKYNKMHFLEGCDIGMEVDTHGQSTFCFLNVKISLTVVLVFNGKERRMQDLK